MPAQYRVTCSCGSTEATMEGPPLASVRCHCVQCRKTRETDIYEATAWKKENVSVSKGTDQVATVRPYKDIQI